MKVGDATRVTTLQTYGSHTEESLAIMTEPTQQMEHVSIKDEKMDKVDEDDVVNPWEVATSSATGVDYDKLISKQSIFLCKEYVDTQQII